jgi:GDP-mannose 6-dehydrogenase
MFEVSVFGLGYIGCVTAACLARAGHRVIGVDVNAEKVRAIRDGLVPVREPGLDVVVRAAVASGHLTATVDAGEAARASRISLVCVGTPGKDNGSLDTTAIERVSSQIGAALAAESDRHLVIVRSTALPGTVGDVVVPTLERASGRRVGVDLDVCVNPEFLRAGSAIEDFASPPFLLVGTDSLAVASEVQHLFALEAPLRVVSVASAELVKYAYNAFRALKVAFANEIGATAKAQNLDGREVLSLLCEDTRLNLSSAYLRPGLAFGGSCLPKDLRALVYRAAQADVETPLLRGVLASNERQIERALSLIASTQKKRIAVLGLTFKAGTDDMRESPAVALIERLLGKGYKLTVHDPTLADAHLVGANLAYVEHELPHLSSLLRTTVEDALSSADVVVITRSGFDTHALAAALRPGQRVLDLANSLPGLSIAEGLSW